MGSLSRHRGADSVCTFALTGRPVWEARVGVLEKCISSGNTLFTLLGFVSLYMLLGLLFLVLVGKTINEGPTHQIN